MKNWLNNYFVFTKREYNGLLALLTLLLAATVFPFIHAKYESDKENITINEQAILQKLSLINEEKEYSSGHYFAAKKDRIGIGNRYQLFDFDPNRIGIVQWQKLGLSTKQASAIINYVHKGGRFYKAEDLQKMYTITVQKYQELLPFVKFEEQLRSQHQQIFHQNRLAVSKRESLIIELNNADTLALDKIRGIGAAFARRIFNYRERLGGFYRKEQLMEVYGLDSLKFEEIRDQIRIDESYLKKIDINSATFDELKRHPYLKYKHINAIIQYRTQHGKFNNIADLKKVAILTAENIEQLAPYLTF